MRKSFAVIQLSLADDPARMLVMRCAVSDDQCTGRVSVWETTGFEKVSTGTMKGSEPIMISELEVMCVRLERFDL